MDYLNVPSALILVWDIRRTIEKNLSLKEALQTFLTRNLKDKFAVAFAVWAHSDRGLGFNEKQYVSTQNIEQHDFNAQHRAVLLIIEAGLRGRPIYEQICDLEADYIEICEADIQKHVAKLPIIMQIPLIFLVFPAICILLLIPTLGQLTL